MLIKYQVFKGISPKVDATLLPEAYAQTAENCDLRSGSLSPLNDLGTGASLGADSNNWRSLYKEEDTDKWLYWAEDDIDIVKSPVADGDNRLVYTGDGYPKQTDDTLMAASGNPDSTADYRRLGVTPPSAALTINGPYGTGDGTVEKSVSYYYTYVCVWADGTEEESAPSTATAVTDVEGGEYLALSNFVFPSLVSSGNNVTHYRVYRLQSGTAGAEFQLGKMRPGAAGATAVYDLPVADVPLITTLVYDCNSVPDELNSDLGEVCPTEGWDAPPDNLSHIGQHENGILGGFSGKEFCVSEPFVPYAWNEDHRITLNYTPVAWGFYHGLAIVATSAFPAIITGIDPATLTQKTLPYNYGCLSSRGFVVTDIGVMYPSADGLVLIDENDARVVTRNLITKQQWAEMPPAAFDHSDLTAFYYDNMYFGFWKGSSQGFMFNFKEDPYLTTFDAGIPLYHGTIDPIDDALYLLTSSNGVLYAQEWNASASSLTLTYKSRKYLTVPSAFIFCRIIGEQSGTTPVTLKIYGDGAEVSSQSVDDTDLFRIPLAANYKSHEFQVSGKAEIDRILLSTSSGEIIGADI
jgi:hypothetical protein